MINFKPIELGDKEVFEKYYKINKDISSEYNFTTLFAWQEIYNNRYAIVNDCLCVKSDNGYLFPIGEKKNVQGAFDEILEYKRENNKKLVFLSITDRMLEEFENLDKGNNEFEIKDLPDNYDYIYKTEKLVTLAGRKMRKKRNHYNFFEREFQYEFIDLDNKFEDDLIEKITELITGRSENPKEERHATLKILNLRKELNLTSSILFEKNKIIGVIVAQEHNETALIHIAKADIEYRGASVALFHLFLKENLRNCEYSNFMEDLGIKGLRKMKESYYPDMLVKKHQLTLI